MANQNQNPPAPSVNAEQLQPVKELLQEFKGRATDASEGGNLFLLSVYNDLLAVTSDIVVKADTRIAREEKAALNKAERELRKNQREERERAQTSA